MDNNLVRTLTIRTSDQSDGQLQLSLLATRQVSAQCVKLLRPSEITVNKQLLQFFATFISSFDGAPKPDGLVARKLGEEYILLRDDADPPSFRPLRQAREGD